MINIVTYTLTTHAIVLSRMLCIKTTAEHDNQDTVIPQAVAHAVNTLMSDGLADNAVFTEYNPEKHYNAIPQEHFTDGISLCYIFNIRCDAPAELSMLTHQPNSSCGLWVNGKFICDRLFPGIFQLPLDAGDNFFCFYFNKPTVIPELTVRINRLENERGYRYSSLTTDNYSSVTDRVALIDLNYLWSEPIIYKGYLYALNHIDVDITQDVQAKILNYYSDIPLEVHTVKFYEPFEISLFELKYFDDDRLNYFKIQFEYTLKSGQKHSVERYFLFEPMETGKEKLRKAAASILDDPNVLDFTKTLVKYRLEQVEAAPDTTFVPYEAMMRDLQRIESGLYSKYEYISGRNIIYYHSKLDDSLYHYEIYLPKNYDKTKSYPLVLNQACNEFRDATEMLAYHQYESDVIFANVTARGVTVGSYIGEATANEVIDDICKRFNVDDTRITSLGFSNGAAATWLSAQLIPHRYAAIAPYAGYFHPDLIKNLCNMKIFSVLSPFDTQHYRDAMEYSDELSHIGGYSLIEVDTMTHAFLSQVYVNKHIINTLSQCNGDKYPNNISFRAIHNRHLKAYWITIHSIEDNYEYGDIEVNVEDDQTICVECSHITGFTIHVPPQICGDNIDVIVNGQRIECKRTHYNEISIVKVVNGDADIYKLGEKDTDSFKIYHGTGLIDVYLTPLSIINFGTESEEMCSSAQEFSSPQMNTFQPKIYVAYPIHTPDTLDITKFSERSLIVLDNNSSHEYAKYLRSLCEIETDEQGFVYKGKRYNGEYMVMQIVKHPSDDNCCILHINTNNTKLYSRNFFTRNVRLPMYGHMRHPYLNNAALVMWENRYHVIYEYGQGLCEV